MTLFEYLSVAVSIVLSLSVVRLVGGLQAAFDPARRYWIHWGWVVAKVVSCLLFWWNFWLYREGVAWNFGYFLFAFLGPIILYVQAAALVPANPSGVHSWRDQFFEVHRLFYLANALLLVHLGVAPALLLSDVPVATFRKQEVLESLRDPALRNRKITQVVHRHSAWAQQRP